VVDAAMRQLNSEGYLPNRARMIVASFLAHDLRVDWRRGAGHFLRTLVDGDVAINNVNWQWLAGTDLPRSGFRPLSPLRQSLRFDAEGDYIRRYVPELSSLRDGAVHDPDPAIRHRTGYPLKIVERARRSP
jgi:deoxyribodipyrimidine photo-lyase